MNDVPSLQTLYSTVRSHLLKQRARSTGVYGNCKYHGPNGMSCAVGCLIPPDVDTSDIDGRNVFNDKVVELLTKLNKLPPQQDERYTAYLSVLSALQSAHDKELPKTKNLDLWSQYERNVVDRLDAVAAYFTLRPIDLDELQGVQS